MPSGRRAGRCALRLVGARRRRLRARRVVSGRPAPTGRVRWLRPSWNAPRPAASGAPGARCARRLHGLELLLHRVGRCARRRMGRRQPDAPVPHRLRSVRSGAVDARGGGGRPQCVRAGDGRRGWVGNRSGRRGRWSRPSSSTAGSPRPVGYENASAALFLVAFWAALLVAARRQTPRWRAGDHARNGRGASPAHDPGPEPRCAGRGRRHARPRRGPGLRPRYRSSVRCSRWPPPPRRRCPRCSPSTRRRPEDPDLGPIAIVLGLSAGLLFAAGFAPRAGRTLGGSSRVPPLRAGVAAAVLVTAASAALAVAVGAPGGLALRSGSRLGPVRLLARGNARVRSAPDRWRGSRQLRARLRPRAEAPRRAALPAQPRAARGRAVGRRGRSCCWRSSWARSWSPYAGSRRATSAAGPWRSPPSSLGAAWVVHGSIDWLWEVPAVGAPAMACLGLAAGLGRRDAAVAGRYLDRRLCRRGDRRLRRSAVAGAAGARCA